MLDAYQVLLISLFDPTIGQTGRGLVHKPEKRSVHRERAVVGVGEAAVEVGSPEAVDMVERATWPSNSFFSTLFL
jgi:hypothetical protein